MTFPHDTVEIEPLREDVARLKDRPRADVIIVGGGINGIATFRDLALQGIDVVLVERGDYCSGASAASSHMIHGGIRYLENGEFRLVRESVRERNALLRMAPHYVRPLKTTIPIFSTVSGVLSAPLRFLAHHQIGKPKERGALLIKLGLIIYDAFSRDGGAVPRHRFLGRRKSLAENPELNPSLKYTATYYDASVHDPERFALDILIEARAHEHARSANYLPAVGMTENGIMVRDSRSGEEFELTADVILNTSGPWTDLTNEAFGLATRFMGGTKGSHIVLDHPELFEACKGGEIFFENNDGRIVLIYPIKGHVLVGTTDLETDIRERSVCTDDEVDYFIELVGHVFPRISIPRWTIVHSFSGVRPLPHHSDTAPGFVSRDYRIERTKLGAGTGRILLSLVGGKWTTFRALSEHLANETLALLGSSRTVSTAGSAIGGGRGYPTTPATRKHWIMANAGGLPTGRVDTLLERYGTKATDVIRFMASRQDIPLQSAPEYSTAEIEYLCEQEVVVQLQDLLLRRTSLAFTGQASRKLIEECATVAGSALDWSDERRLAEIEDTLRVLRENHPIPFPMVRDTIEEAHHTWQQVKAAQDSQLVSQE